MMETRCTDKNNGSERVRLRVSRDRALTLALNEEEKKYLESSYKLLQQNKYEVEWLPNIEAVVQCDPGMAGSKIAAAIHTPLSGFVDPMLLCHAFANAAQKKGVVLLENHDAQRIEKLRDFSKRRYGVSFNTGLTVCLIKWSLPPEFSPGEIYFDRVSLQNVRSQRTRHICL